MPVQKPGKSETIVRTPPEFLAAAKKLLGIQEFTADLACCEDNKVAPFGLTKEMDSLSIEWSDLAEENEWLWLNPPYDNIAPWAEKCYHEELMVAMLVPSSTGSNWWDDFVHNKAHVQFLKGRITFLDKFGKPICSPRTGKPTPYPKDLALILYGVGPGYDVWNWRKPIP